MTTECVYHAAPLHYLPCIVRDGALYAQSVLATRGIRPRATAARRDRMLGLADYIHLSLRPQTPLLADKVAKGYPHALLAFRRREVMALPQVALLPYNTKAWHTRAAYAPVTDRERQEGLLRRHRETGRYPSLEVLVKYGLELTLLERVIFLTEAEKDMIAALCADLDLSLPAPQVTDAGCFPRSEGYTSVTGDRIAVYFSACRSAGTVLPPPELPFD